MILNDKQIKKLVEDHDMINPFINKSPLSAGRMVDKTSNKVLLAEASSPKKATDSPLDRWK